MAKRYLVDHMRGEATIKYDVYVYREMGKRRLSDYPANKDIAKDLLGSLNGCDAKDILKITKIKSSKRVGKQEKMTDWED